MGRRKEISDEQRSRWARSAGSPRRFDGVTVPKSGHHGDDATSQAGFVHQGRLGSLSGGVSPERKEIERLKKELAERDQVIGEQTIAIRVLKKLRGLKLTIELKELMIGEQGCPVAPEKVADCGVCASLADRGPGILQPDSPVLVPSAG